MATTDCGVTVPPAPVAPERRRRRTSLRPLATGTYFPIEPAVPRRPATRSTRSFQVVLRAAPFALVTAAVSRYSPLPIAVEGFRSEMWWSWSHQVSGAGSSSYPMARALEVGAEAAGDALGLAGLATVAAALYAAWAVTWLAGRFVRPVAAALAGLAAVVNPYVLDALADLRVLVLVGLAASLGALVCDAGIGRRVAPLLLIVCAVPLSLVATDPLTLAALGSWLLVCAIVVAVVGGLDATLRLIRSATWAVPLTLATQLWWLVPAAQAFSSRREGVEVRLAFDGPLLAAVLVPPMALGAAAGLDWLWRRAETRRRTGARRWRAFGLQMTALAAVAGVFALPVLLSPSPTTTSSPNDWQAAADAVNASSISGKALVLDADLPRRLLTRPVLQRSASGPLRPAPAVDQRVTSLARNLAAGDTAAATAGLDQLGVSHLVLGHDVTPAVQRLRGWRPAAHTKVADVYERVRPAPVARSLPIDDGAATPDVSWRPVDPAHHVVTIDAASGPFVLALAETYGPGWHLTGLPKGWSAHHQLVDGYANGWRIDGTGTANLHIVHRPSDAARIAAYVSAAVATVVAALTVALVLQRRLRAAAPQSP